MSTIPEDIQTYSEMLSEYLGTSEWIGPSELPLVHLLRDLCRQIDNSAGADASGHLVGRYLAAFGALDKRRPRPVRPADTARTEDDDQTSIFDFID